MKLNTITRLLIGIAIFGTISCDNTSEEKNKYDALYNEVIAAHDEVMPKMGELSGLSQQLKQRVESTQTSSVIFEKGIEDLENSYDFMMEWMRDFSEEFVKDQTPFEELSPEERKVKIKALEEEVTNVNKLKDQINGSIESAKELIEQ
ncbi:hypothetical protein ACKGJN_12185 [Gillisia sp. Q332]|uniref:hypothetical protein n=1 Tax=Gillisia xinjiangensis TaxID=3384765 RepID=UPI003918F66F